MFALQEDKKSAFKWIFGLNYDGDEKGQWKLSMDRNGADDPVIVQVEIKILKSDGSEYLKGKAPELFALEIII